MRPRRSAASPIPPGRRAAASDRLRHLPSRIDREDDLVVAFGAIFLGVELSDGGPIASSRSRAGPCPSGIRPAHRNRCRRRDRSVPSALAARDAGRSARRAHAPARTSGRPRSCASASIACCFHTSPSVPRQRSHSLSSRALPAAQRIEPQRIAIAPCPPSSGTAMRPSSSSRAAMAGDRDLGAAGRARRPAARRHVIGIDALDIDARSATASVASPRRAPDTASIAVSNSTVTGHRIDQRGASVG
jgi:hypothetical protein